MSGAQEREIVLGMLESGSINATEAETLLNALKPASNSRLTRDWSARLNRPAGSSPRLQVEINADEEDLRKVLAKLNEGLGEINS